MSFRFFSFGFPASAAMIGARAAPHDPPLAWRPIPHSRGTAAAAASLTPLGIPQGAISCDEAYGASQRRESFGTLSYPRRIRLVA